MKTAFVHGSLFIVAALLFTHTHVRSQMMIEWIFVQDDSGPGDSTTMFFGNSPGATYGIDSLSPTIREVEGTLPPPGFWTIWVNTPGRVNPYGNGLLRWDFHGVQEVDTFALRITNFDNPTANFTFTWLDSCSIVQNRDSMFLVDSEGKRVDMLRQRQLRLATPVDSGPRTFYIITYGSFWDGWNCINTAAADDPSHPREFSLAQNFPNPFNPSTMISYELPTAGFVTLKVFDVLGRSVTTLVSEEQMPGPHTVTWSADGLAGGIYYYRLITGTTTAVRKMAVVK